MAVRVQTKPVRCCAASTVARPQRASGGDLLPRDADPWERDAAAATCSREMPTRGSETSSGVNDHRPRVSHRCRAGAQASPAGPGVTWQPVARVRSPAGGSGSWLRRATLTAPTAAPRPQVVVPSREVSRGGPPRRCRAAGASSDGHMTGRRTELRARYRELMGGWPSRRSRGERAEVGRGLPPSSFEGDGTSARRGCLPVRIPVRAMACAASVHVKRVAHLRLRPPGHALCCDAGLVPRGTSRRSAMTLLNRSADDGAAARRPESQATPRGGRRRARARAAAEVWPGGGVDSCGPGGRASATA